MPVWADRVSEEVDTATTSDVDVDVGLVTVLAVINTVSPPAMVPQPALMLTVTVAPPLPVTGLEYSPHCVPVVTSSIA